MEFGRILMVHFVNQFLEARFGFWCGLEREQQVIEGQAVGDGAAIVAGAEGGGCRVSGQGDQLRLVNRAGNYWLGTIGISSTLGGTLGESGCGEKCGENKRQNSREERKPSDAYSEPPEAGENKWFQHREGRTTLRAIPQW